MLSARVPVTVRVMLFPGSRQVAVKVRVLPLNTPPLWLKVVVPVQVAPWVVVTLLTVRPVR